MALKDKVKKSKKGSMFIWVARNFFGCPIISKLVWCGGSFFLIWFGRS